MAEKLPSPPLTGIATKIVGESPDVSLEEKVIQKNYEKLVDDLDVKSSVDLFYGRELITSDTMERINNATTRKDANRVLINDLIKGISPSRLLRFVSLLRESADKYKHPHHKTLADKLEGDLKTAHESGPSPSQLTTNEAQVKGPLDSPHIHRLRDHLYKRYKRFKVGERGDKMEFVRLAVLKGQVNVPKDEEEIRDKLAFLRRFRNCGKEERQIAGYIDAFDLLHKSSGSIRVVYGQPGIGKTTLLTHVCRALAMKEADSEYALVLYFPLRNKKVSGAKTLSELLSYYTSDNKKLDLSGVEQSLVDSEEKQTLLILDGADEVRELLSVPDSSVIQEILAGNTLPQADVIVSSRPGSLPFLQRPSSSFYEIHGFDQASIDRYIEDFFKGTPEKAEKMMKELHSRPDLLGGAHIPMNLFIYCSVYDYGKLPPTITECHKKFLCNVVKREYEKCGIPCQVDPSLSRLSPEVRGLFKSLGALAYEGMMKNPPVFVFDESDIRRAFHTLPPEAVVEESIFKGLLVQHSCTVGYEEVNTFNFSHTTNHEFFVAWHISHLPKADQLQFAREHFSDPKFAVVVRFYSGLTGLSTPGVTSLLCQSVSARSTSSVFSPAISFSLPSQCFNHDPSLLYLLHALYESQNLALTESIVKHLKQSLVFHLFLTSHDTLAIAHCLDKCTHLKHLSFLSDVVKLPPSSLPHVVTILKANSHLLSLKLPVEHLSSTDATALISGTAVEELDLDVRETTLSALSAIFHSRTIKEWKLDISSLSKDCDSGEEKQDLSHSVSENTTLRKLVLHGSSDYMTAVLHGVAASATIEDLEVWGHLPPDGGEHDVAKALAKCVVNPKLRIVETWSLPPLPVMKGLTTREVPLEVLVISPHWRKNGEDLKEVERTAAKIRVVRKLVLYGGPSDCMTAVLHGVAASATIEDLEVRGGEHDVAEALAKCVVNPKLRRVEMWSLPPLPVMKGLTTREIPLEELVIHSPRWRKDGEDLKEVERTAAKMRVVRKLVLRGPSDYMTAVLHGVAASATIEDLKVEGLLSPDGGEHDVTEALAKCVVNPKLRIVETWSLPPLTVMKGLTTREVPLEELVISPIWRRGGEDLKELERTAAKMRVVRKLVLHECPSDYMTAVLHGVAASATIEDLEMRGLLPPVGGEHDVAEALAKCVVNSKLRRVVMVNFPSLPVMEALTTREVPLEELVIKYSYWWRGTVFSEDHLKEMERSAAKIRVRKVIFDVDYNTALHDAVSSGLGENKCLQDVTLRCVPEEKKQFVRSKLSAAGNPSCNVQLSSPTPENMSFSSPQRPPFHAHEAELKKLCWIPFGIQTLTVGEKGGLFPLHPQTMEAYKDDDVITLEVPGGAVDTAVCDRLCIRYGVIVYGPFDLPEGYQLGSMVVYIYIDQDHAVKPFVLHLPHWSGKDGESGLKCVVAPHRLEEGEEKYKFKDVEEGDFQSREGRSLITIDAHCSLFAKAFKDGFGSNYLATSLIQKSKKGLRAVTKVAVTHSSPIWISILKEHRKGLKVENKQTFSFEKEDVGVSLKLVEAKGPGWEANVLGYLLPKDVQYETYKIESPKQLKQAVKDDLYPPCLTCKVTSSREAKKSGKHKDVKFVLEGTERPTDHMGFTCPAYEEKATERDTPIGMNSTPHQEPSTPTHMTAGRPSIQLNSLSLEHVRLESPQRPRFHELSPSDIGLSNTLEAIAEWHNLAVNLGVPIGQVQAFKSDPVMGALLALKYWRDGKCGEKFPSTWRFLLLKIETTFGGKVAENLERKASGKPTWSQ